MSKYMLKRLKPGTVHRLMDYKSPLTCILSKRESRVHDMAKNFTSHRPRCLNICYSNIYHLANISACFSSQAIAESSTFDRNTQLTSTNGSAFVWDAGLIRMENNLAVLLEFRIITNNGAKYRDKHIIFNEVFRNASV